MRSWFIGLLFVLGDVALGASQVFVVDAAGSPGSDFVDLQPAIAAATDGDVIVVRPGSYAAATISNESLTIQGVPDLLGVRPEVVSIQVIDLAASKRVVVRGLRAHHVTGAVFGAFAAYNCAGPILVEDCVMEEALGIFGGDPGAFLLSCQSVTFVRCSFTGLKAYQPVGPFDQPIFAGPGVTARNSTVHLYESELEGGPGTAATISLFGAALQSLPGAHALFGDQASDLFLAGSTVTGGVGGAGLDLGVSGCLPAAFGGSGVSMIGGTLIEFDNVVVGGAAGATPPACSGGAANGQAFQLGGGAVATHLPEQNRSFEMSGVVLPGGAIAVDYAGQPGENLTLLFAFGLAGTYAPAAYGVLVGSGPLGVLPLGAVPGSGSLSFTTTIPASALPPGVFGVDVFAQCFVGGGTGFGLLSCPSVTSIVTKK